MKSSGDIALRLQGVGKRYWQLEEQAILLKSIVPLWRPTRSELWALRDLNIEVHRGETVGIMGHNGAGKTTMLRLLAGVTQPTEGEVLIRGRVAPLISVGVGFHPEMTGRENVYVNGMLLGLSRREVEARFDEIVAFAELEKFIDTPVKFYSSGMFMRLGFAVAVSSDPDVLLVDEVLAVGDLAFQLKCFERMRAIQAQGTTVVLVSHSTHAIRLLCPRTLVISAGRVRFDGETPEAINVHFDLLSRGRPDAGLGTVGLPVEVSDRQVVGPTGPIYHLPYDQQVTFKARLHFHQEIEHVHVQFQVYSHAGAFVYGHRTLAGISRRFEQGEEAEVAIPFQQRLGGDTYRLVLNVLDREGAPLYSDSEGLLVYVAGKPGSAGLVDLQASIVLDGETVSEEVDLLMDARRDRPLPPTP
jgi:ABC-type polysaccharide/polyol phosphate transport system ATPase subunit